MRYEIITDNDDILVLVVNSRVIEISEDMSSILRTIEENYSDILYRKAKAAERAKQKDMEENANSLGKLFDL
jgi:hypothetical protein